MSSLHPLGGKNEKPFPWCSSCLRCQHNYQRLHFSLHRLLERAEQQILEQQIANHQVTQEIREKFLKDKKAFKVTTQIVIVLFLCYLPTIISRIILDKYIPENGISLDTTYIVIFSSGSVVLLNSVINPILYSIKIRELSKYCVKLLKPRKLR